MAREYLNEKVVFPSFGSVEELRSFAMALWHETADAFKDFLFSLDSLSKEELEKGLAYHSKELAQCRYCLSLMMWRWLRHSTSDTEQVMTISRELSLSYFKLKKHIKETAKRREAVVEYVEPKWPKNDEIKSLQELEEIFAAQSPAPQT